MKAELASEVAQRRLTSDERELLLNQCINWGSLTSQHGTVTNQALAALTRDDWMILEVSQETSDLLAHFSQLLSHYVEKLQELAANLSQVSQEQSQLLRLSAMPNELEG